RIFFGPSERARADLVFGRADRVVAVAAAELEPVDSLLARHLVHREFQREASLRPAGRAHRRRGTRVRIDVAFLGADIGASIDRLERTRAACTAADPAASTCDELDRGQLSVAIDPQLDLLLRVGTVTRRTMLVATREHHLDRHAGRLGQPRGNNHFGGCAEFRAEATTEELADYAHIVGWQTEIHSQIVAHGKNALRRAPYRELVSRRVEARNRAVRLEADMRLHGRRIGSLDRVR